MFLFHSWNMFGLYVANSADPQCNPKTEQGVYIKHFITDQKIKKQKGFLCMTLDQHSVTAVSGSRYSLLVSTHR